MSMHMTSADLDELASVISKLNKSEIEVRKIRFKGHDVYLELSSDMELVVRGITDKTDGGDANISKQAVLTLTQNSYGR